MLVNFRQEVIFVKTYKTAGTSVEAVLQSALFKVAPDHVQGWKFYADGFVTPRFDGLNTPASQKTSSRDKLLLAKMALLHRVNPNKLKKLRNHSTSLQISNAIGEARFARFHKVLPVRNPYDLLVSSYFWAKHRGKDVPNFEDWVMGQKTMAKANAAIPRALDESWKVIRFEQLQEDLRVVFSELGLGDLEEMPFFKKTNQTGVARDYRTMYSAPSRKHVELIYANWFEAFGYEW